MECCDPDSIRIKGKFIYLRCLKQKVRYNRKWKWVISQRDNNQTKEFNTRPKTTNWSCTHQEYTALESGLQSIQKLLRKIYLKIYIRKPSTHHFVVHSSFMIYMTFKLFSYLDILDEIQKSTLPQLCE